TPTDHSPCLALALATIQRRRLVAGDDSGRAHTPGNTYYAGTKSYARAHERPWGSLTSSGTRRWPARARTPASASSATTTPKGDSWRRLRRKPKTATDAAPEAAAAVGPRSPTVYDWVVISSLDR
ncbi:Os08g0453200, partial [Oryza sativa Japonica Group]